MQRQEITTYVLVVDNDWDTRAVLRDVLEEEGYAVTLAADGYTALAVMRAVTRPLVVVLDQGLAGMTGTELVEAILRDGQPAVARAFLLLTASPERLPAPFSKQEWPEVMPVIAKPFDLEALLEAVAAAARRLDGNSAIAVPS
jgi:CheY-like chemotaxis protein